MYRPRVRFHLEGSLRHNTYSYNYSKLGSLAVDLIDFIDFISNFSFL